MKGQEFDICDLPFDGYYAPQVERIYRPWGCPLSRHHGHHHGPFGRPGFDHGPENYGSQHWLGHHRFGPFEDGHRRPGCGRWGPPKRDGNGPAEHQCHGPPGFPAGHYGRSHNFSGHGANRQHFGSQPWWFGRRGPSESQERPWTGPWGGPGPDQRP